MYIADSTVQLSTTNFEPCHRERPRAQVSCDQNNGLEFDSPRLLCSSPDYVVATVSTCGGERVSICHWFGLQPASVKSR